jgi:ADP-ribose pyrophosphatase
MEHKNGNWTIKETEKKFHNDFFTVYEDKVIKPDGKDGTYATIKFIPGVAVLPIDESGNVYLTCQFRYALGCDNVEAVCGAINDESPAKAAKREAKEELGIEAHQWVSLGKIQTDTSITNSTSHLFLARGLTFSQPEQESTEEIKTVIMKLDDAVQKVLSGEITNGPTCVLILKAAANGK